MPLVEAQVTAAAVSYFSTEKVIGPDGEPMTDPNTGREIYTNLRHTAVLGQTVEMSQYEFDRNAREGAVRVPEDTPIRPEFPLPTPFGTPLPDADGNMRAFTGPVMGDPKPTAGLSDVELRNAAGALTPEESAALHEQAVSGVNDESDSAIGDRDYEAAHKAALEAEVSRRGLEVEGTGQNGNIVKDDLIMALEADDEESGDE